VFAALRILTSLVFLVTAVAAQEAHSHVVPEQLGTVSFPISCKPEVQQEFNRGVALLHSFAYDAARESFRIVAAQDPHCAMAHWGAAMAYYRQLWEPPILSGSYPSAQREIEQALALNPASPREQGLIHAADAVFQDAATVPYSSRAANYEKAMGELAATYPKDAEIQVFYALALLANASPSDKTHSRQKRAADLLEPLYAAYPQHPGTAHYLIHACDNAEMAQRGLPAARSYAKIAPSAPHALHMPSHIFTRLGLWDDSIASNLAAREAAHKAGDIGEELHSMDYLVYAYLQTGRDTEAGEIVQQAKGMTSLNLEDFKVAYASTAMPVRFAVERKHWADAATIAPVAAAPPQVAAIAVWARALGLARGGHAADAATSISDLQRIEDSLHAASNDYWVAQVRILNREIMAWSAQAQGQGPQAVLLMRQAADEEDSMEKLPVTPGPIVPAREQLGQLLLEQGQVEAAGKEFALALAGAPGRKCALEGAAAAAERNRAAARPAP
jgi:tetratricopeptide (TPR) repeat protein